MIGQDTKKRPRTTLLIPCFNEAEGIHQLCNRLGPVVQRLRLTGPVEIIFVDDGSTDSTAHCIRQEAVRLPYKIVTHEHNRGLGAALRTGFAASIGQEVVTLDSDCTYDPMGALELLRKLREGNDLVTGSPYHPRGEVVGVQGWRLFISKSLSHIYWLILPVRLYTYTSCFRAYRREILPELDLRSDGFLGVTQLLVSAILKGYRVAEVPSRLTKRQFGLSKIRVVRVIISHLEYLLYVLCLRLSQRFRVPGKGDAKSSHS